MLKVAVCDDNKTFLQETVKLLQQDNRISEIVSYHSLKDLLTDINTGAHRFDAIFLDIDFPDEAENGISAAGRMLHLAPGTQIVYITGYNDRYSQHILLTDAEVTGYLTKPVDAALLSRYLDKIAAKVSKREYLTMSVRGKKRSVLCDDIFYMESSDHSVLIHTEDAEIKIYERLDNLLKRLPPFFIRSHKSYIINMEYICHLDTNRALLTNGVAIPISRTYRTSTREAFFRHIGEDV